MPRYTWRATLLPEKRSEYIKRHDELWPEMKVALKECGISNYSIWLSGQDLFGYYECADPALALEMQNANPVVQRWDVYMDDVIILHDPAINQEEPEEVFYLP